MDYATAITSVSPFVAPRHTDVLAGPIVAGGRLLDSVVDRDLQGTLEEIAGQIEVRAEDLVTALAQLTEVGWVALEPHSDGRVCLRLADDAR
jgi:hypothetical protein